MLRSLNKSNLETAQKTLYFVSTVFALLVNSELWLYLWWRFFYSGELWFHFFSWSAMGSSILGRCRLAIMWIYTCSDVTQSDKTNKQTRNDWYSFPEDSVAFKKLTKSLTSNTPLVSTTKGNDGKLQVRSNIYCT